MITNGITKMLAIPHEPGQTIEIRMLGWATLRAASDAQSRAALAKARDMGADLLSTLRAVAPADAVVDALAGYDQGELLRAGIVSWSYSHEVRPEDLAGLDSVTAEWAAREILRYATDTGTEVERGNGSAPSIGR